LETLHACLVEQGQMLLPLFVKSALNWQKDIPRKWSNNECTNCPYNCVFSIENIGE